MSNESSQLSVKRFELKENDFGIQFNQYNPTCGIHCHGFCEIEIYTGGEGTHIINGLEFDLHRGCVAVLRYGDVHEHMGKSDNPLEFYDISFLYSIIGYQTWKLICDINTPIVAEFPEEDFEHIIYIARCFRKAANDNCSESPYIIRSGLEWILSNTIKILKPNIVKKKVGVDQDIYKALTYIQKNLSSNLTLTNVAEELHYTPSYFGQYFRKHTGTSFREYLRNLRLNFAMELVKMSDLPITDICFDAGFSSLSYFSRAFAQKFGNSPNFFKKQR